MPAGRGMGMMPPSTLSFCRLEVRWRWGADVGFVQWDRRRCNVLRCRSRRPVCQDLRQGSAHQGSLVRLQACPSRHLQGSGPRLGTSRLIHTPVTFLCSLPSQLPVVKDPESVTYSSSRLCCLFVQYSLKALLLFAADAARATVPCFPSECARMGGCAGARGHWTRRAVMCVRLLVSRLRCDSERGSAVALLRGRQGLYIGHHDSGPWSEPCHPHSLFKSILRRVPCRTHTASQLSNLSPLLYDARPFPFSHPLPSPRWRKAGSASCCQSVHPSVRLPKREGVPPIEWEAER